MHCGLQPSRSAIILSRRSALLGHVGGVGLHFCLSSVACYVLYADPVASRAASDGPVLESWLHLVGTDPSRRASNLAPEVRAILSNRGHVLAVVKRGTNAAACKGSWRLAMLQTVHAIALAVTVVLFSTHVTPSLRRRSLSRSQKYFKLADGPPASRVPVLASSVLMTGL